MEFSGAPQNETSLQSNALQQSDAASGSALKIRRKFVVFGRTLSHDDTSKNQEIRAARARLRVPEDCGLCGYDIERCGDERPVLRLRLWDGKRLLVTDLDPADAESCYRFCALLHAGQAPLPALFDFKKFHRCDAARRCLDELEAVVPQFCVWWRLVVTPREGGVAQAGHLYVRGNDGCVTYRQWGGGAEPPSAALDLLSCALGLDAGTRAEWANAHRQLHLQYQKVLQIASECSGEALTERAAELRRVEVSETGCGQLQPQRSSSFVVEKPTDPEAGTRRH